jgi:hypothetical protein
VTGVGVSAYVASDDGRVSMRTCGLRNVPLSTHIAALERDLRFGKAGGRTGRRQDQRIFF